MYHSEDLSEFKVNMKVREGGRQRLDNVGYLLGNTNVASDFANRYRD